MPWETAAYNEERLMDVYNACVRYVAIHHNFPTFRWIMANTDITSTSMVRYYLDKLIHQKLIKEVPGRRGAFKIMKSIWMPPITAGLSTALHDELISDLIHYSMQVPVMESILEREKQDGQTD